jgi:nucleotide-binding universal stress UspA family protein
MRLAARLRRHDECTRVSRWKTDRSGIRRSARPADYPDNFREHTMYRNILVAIDGSHTSELALAEAIRLAGERQGRLLIVHVEEAMVDYNLEGDLIDTVALQEAVRKADEALLARALAQAREAGVEAETRLLDNDAAGSRASEAIAAEADAWHADLIVVGSHGRRGLSRLFLGSVAEGVARVADKPVLLIRGR